MNNSSNKNAALGKKKRGKFNFVDATLILILLLVIAALIYVFSPISLIKNMMLSQEKTIEYTILVTDVEIDSLEKFEEQVSLIDSVNKGTLGTVTTIKADTHTEYTPVKDTNKDGEEVYVMKKIEYPDKYDVLITVRTTADYIKDQGYTVGSTRIAVGEKMNLKFPNYVCSGYCESISVF